MHAFIDHLASASRTFCRTTKAEVSAHVALSDSGAALVNTDVRSYRKQEMQQPRLELLGCTSVRVRVIPTSPEQSSVIP